MIIFLSSFGTSKARRKTPKNNPYCSLLSYNINHPDGLNFADELVPSGDNKVRAKMARCLQRHTYGHVQTNILQQKAERWFPVIEPLLLKYGIPDDFKFIPLVEAGFGEGRSGRGAYGPWQFMPGTARTYGLKVNSRRDERTDIRKATIAACLYIQELHCEFKSWIMVAAAYNTGSPNLAHLVRNQKQGNYFKIKMNRETGAYVYSLIAMKEIINHPAAYGYNYQKPVYAMLSRLNGDILTFN
jgi:membrane-bound lytic murein transglycosylase D